MRWTPRVHAPLSHDVLPKGFRRIRHFGFLANSCCVQKLARIRAALDVPNPEPSVESEDCRERYALLTGRRLDICPCCGGRMVDAEFTAASFAATFSATV